MSTAILRMGAKGEAVREWQRELHRNGLAGVCGAVDGVFGVKTDAATRQLQARHGLPDNGVTNAATREAAARWRVVPAIVTVAEGEIGVCEQSRNQGAGIGKYWMATSYPDGMENREPWCAAFVAWCLAEAARREGRTGKLPRSAAVKDWAKDALRLGWTVFGPHDGLRFPTAGDVVVFTFSHIGIVTDFDGRWVRTVEGNTNDAGEREGKKVMRQERSLGLCRSFLRPESGDRKAERETLKG